MGKLACAIQKRLSTTGRKGKQRMNATQTPTHPGHCTIWPHRTTRLGLDARAHTCGHATIDHERFDGWVEFNALRCMWERLEAALLVPAHEGIMVRPFVYMQQRDVPVVVDRLQDGATDARSLIRWQDAYTPDEEDPV
eukprot:1645817-Rhodomonas_salina.1